jgi:branched-chain amino acid transport system permease protein
MLATDWFAHGSLYVQGLVQVAAAFAILAVSLDLVAGSLGLYSLGHAGLFALGAYGTTLLSNNDHWNLFLLLPVSMVGVGVVGLVLGSLSLRVSGLYFTITTFVFTLVLTVLAQDLTLTGGFGGLTGPIFPDFPSALSSLGQSLIWASMIAALVTILVVLAIRRSPFYPVLLAIRDAEPFAAAAGARTALVKIGVFGLSAAMAGAAGWLFSFQPVISPDQFTWSVSVNILVMVIIGGMNTTLGPVIGAAFVSIFPSEVNINPLWQEVLFGAVFIGVIVAFPAGFVGLVAVLARRAMRAVHRSPAAPAPVAAASGAAAAPLELEAIETAARARPGDALADSPAVALAAAVVADAVPAVECRGIVFGYSKETAVVNHVDFVVKSGTIHGLIGPNGSGKSTLVDLVAGRLKPWSGTIALNGELLVKGGPALRARRGFMRTFQAAVLVQELPARENVLVGLYSRVPRIASRSPLWPLLPTARRDARRMRTQANEALDFVGASSWGAHRIADAPHGVEQLTQLAAACVAQPTTLILDEPLAGLSPTEIEHAAAIFADLKSAGVSVILIEHQPRFVFAICDEVTVLDAGEVVASGSAAQVREDRRVREVYLGQ